MNTIKGVYKKKNYPDINFVLKSRSEDSNEGFNKPNTIFFAQARRMHWVCT